MYNVGEGLMSGNYPFPDINEGGEDTKNKSLHDFEWWEKEEKNSLLKKITARFILFKNKYFWYIAYGSATWIKQKMTLEEYLQDLIDNTFTGYGL